MRVAFSLLLLAAAVSPRLGAQGLPQLRLPTENDAILRGDGPGFYQFVDRHFEGQVSHPWEGGRFGMVRSPVRFGGGLSYTRFHEGLDIKPLRRDSAGEPLDDVVSMADGVVVHVSDQAGRSNYGKYIVVRHDWPDGPFYSLYAHLKSCAVAVDQPVGSGAVLGRLGYTGAGIDKRRAHVHVELAILWSAEFQRWYDKRFTSPNHHGIYNGQNLLGLDLGALFVARQRNPNLAVSRFIRVTEPLFEAAVPGSARMEILKNHPWLLEGRPPEGQPPSWVVKFTYWGLPVDVRAGDTAVSTPRVRLLTRPALPIQHVSRGLLAGTLDQPSLSSSGRSFLALACGFEE